MQDARSYPNSFPELSVGCNVTLVAPKPRLDVPTVGSSQQHLGLAFAAYRCHEKELIGLDEGREKS